MSEYSMSLKRLESDIERLEMVEPEIERLEMVEPDSVYWLRN